MKVKGETESEVDIVVRDTVHPFRLHGPCLVRVTPRDGTRVARCGLNSVRIAFTEAEIRVLTAAMNRAYPRFGAVIPSMRHDCNCGYVPSDKGRLFLVAFGAKGSAVRIGMEITGSSAHPVVELRATSQSNVRRTGASVSWMPTWTEFRILCAHFEQTVLQADAATESADTSRPAGRLQRGSAWHRR